MTTLDELDLDPAIVRWNERMAEHAQNLPDLAGPLSPARRAAARELSDLLAVEFTLPIPDAVTIEDVTIDGPGGPLRMRRFRPDGIEIPAPTQLFLHGGGFYGGTIDEVLNDRLCARRSLDAGIQIYSLEYRLAPEYQYPAASEDAIAAVHALAGSAALGADPQRLGIGGNSAGAAIGASAAIMLRDAAGPALVHQGFEVLPAALRAVGSSGEEFSTGFGIEDAADLVEVYVGRGIPPYAAEPLEVPDLSGLPPTLIMAAEYDPLRDGAVAYGERLRDAGVEVEIVIGRGHLHGSVGLTAAMPAARVWQETQARALRAAYHPA